jgi:hypothetical protein
MHSTAPAVGHTARVAPDVLHLLDVPVAAPEPGYAQLRAVMDKHAAHANVREWLAQNPWSRCALHCNPAS